jgi:hypothetical protein
MIVLIALVLWDGHGAVSITIAIPVRNAAGEAGLAVMIITAIMIIIMDIAVLLMDSAIIINLIANLHAAEEGHHARLQILGQDVGKQVFMIQLLILLGLIIMRGHAQVHILR